MEQVTPSEAFTFSFERALEARKDIELRLEALQSRLSTIADKVTLSDHPIIKMILSVSHDADELKKLSAALDRVADIIPTIDELNAQKAMIDLAVKTPDTLKAMFGDYTSDIDKLLSSFENSEG